MCGFSAEPAYVLEIRFHEVIVSLIQAGWANKALKETLQVENAAHLDEDVLKRMYDYTGQLVRVLAYRP